MNSLLDAPRTPSLARPSSARLLVIGAFVVNALLWGFNLMPSAPPQHSLPHMLVSLVIAALLVLRYRWTLVVAALACVAQIVEGLIFLDLIIAAIVGVGTLVCGTLFFALAAFGLIVCIALLVQGTRSERTDAARTREASHWSYPIILLVVVLITAVLLQGVVMARSASARSADETLAGLPVITSRNYRFEPTAMHVKANDTVTFRLVNADAVPHFLDIDELGVHVTMRAGASTMATIRHLQPGTYTFYCHPHGDKVARTGMVGTLIVEA